MAKIRYRLGLDLGANSLGWCVYRLNDECEPVAIHRMGSRIFSDGRDPKSLASRAADRRAARQARRRRDRVLKRRHQLLRTLAEVGLMPGDDAGRKELQKCDPYALRAKGLDSPLTLHELGRALYHLARKRGFRSSRKDAKDAESEKETGKVKEAIGRLKEQIAASGSRTVGEHLAKLHAERQPVRARRTSDGGYVLYLQRDMVAEELEALWKVQRTHHPEVLTDALRDRLLDIILFQRRLKPVMPGRCLFEGDQFRAPLCSPLQQQFRILQELNNLRVKEGTTYRALTLEERDRMHAVLSASGGIVTFAKLAKAAGLRGAAAFNLESEKRKGLRGDATAAFGDANALGDRWQRLSTDTREALALLVQRADDEGRLIDALRALPEDIEVARDVMRPHAHEISLLDTLADIGAPLTMQQAMAVAHIPLPDDFGSLSRAAISRILPLLRSEVLTYDQAVLRAGYTHHSQLHTGEFFKRLPYYGEILRGYTSPAEKARNEAERAFGKIPNPTVHIGLNQLRTLINALIARYGNPEQIVIELARELGLSGQRRREIEKEQADNQARNERFDRKLEALGLRPNRENRLRLQLWEELGSDDAMDRVCIYTGRRIGMSMLFSDEVEIDHILPFSVSLHDGIGNKLLCLRQANRDKGNRDPFSAFGHSPGAYVWGDIIQRVERQFAQSKSPSARRKAELFREGALDAFLAGRDFLDRHLTDTAYLSRAAKQYLSYVCHKDQVWVSTGKLTGMLRGRWGLNSLLSDDREKNRNDHRHHALDAAVIGLCSRSVIKRVSDAARRAEEHGESRLLEGLDLPWPSFRDELRATLAKVMVSHKPDHGRQAALHNDTNYTLVAPPDKSGNPLVGRRVPLESLKGASDAEAVADERLRADLVALLTPLRAGKDTVAALQAFTARTGVRRVLKLERLDVIAIHDRRTGEPYRYVKGDGNYCYEIFLQRNGKWGGEVISLYEANRPDFVESPNTAQNGLPLVMRIRKDDALAMVVEGSRRVLRVARFTDGKIALVAPHEANVDKRTREKSLSYLFKSPGTLQPTGARVVGVDVLGYVNDPAAGT